jgi:XrtJ-associated TM-motif-TM protein
MNEKLLCKVVAGVGLLVAAGVAYAQGGGCDDSPENPTVVLGLLGAASAGVPWLRARWTSRRRDTERSADRG